MNEQILLPLGILLVVCMISFFLPKKENVVNKLLSLAVLAAAFFVVSADSEWWRIGFCILVGAVQPTSRLGGEVETGPCYEGISFFCVFLILANWVLMFLNWLGWFGSWNTVLWLSILALVFGVFYLMNMRKN